MKQILQLGLYLFFCLGLAQNTLAQGDNCNNAEVINALPFQDNGTTDGFSNDYDATCSTSGDPFAPDVVYRYTRLLPMVLSIFHSVKLAVLLILILNYGCMKAPVAQ